MDNLQSATMDELFAEISNRTKAAVLIVEKDARRGDEYIASQSYYHGGISRCTGMGVLYVEKMKSIDMDTESKGEPG